ncbi:MAG: glycosyltransferase family 4 protein [Bdellovibrionales bacterium]|nr:glycosyltransferase family 4 protein [Bdellovibrionales bacterium]
MLTEIATPYRAPVFSQLRKSDRYTFDFFYLAKHQRDRLWPNYNDDRDFILEGSQFCIAGYHTFYFNWNFDILFNDPYDLYIIGGYAQWAMWRVMAFCSRKSIPYILMTESHHSKARSWLKKVFKKVILTKLYSNASANLVMSEKARQYIISFGADEKRIWFFPNTIDSEVYKVSVEDQKPLAKAKLKQWKFNNKICFLFVGTLNQRKGIDLLVEAFSKLNHMQNNAYALVIVGSGKMEAFVRSMVDKMGLSQSVNFGGFVMPKDLPLYYALADIFVLPSREEPFGAVVLEAMAAGLPIITTDVVGAAGMFAKHQENALVIKNNNVEALFLAMQHLSQDLSLRQNMGHCSRRIMESWTHRRLVSNIEAAVQASLESRN